MNLDTRTMEQKAKGIVKKADEMRKADSGPQKTTKRGLGPQVDSIFRERYLGGLAEVRSTIVVSVLIGNRDEKNLS